MLIDSATIRHVCLDANRDDRCIGVIAWMHTFSPAKMWIQGLDELRKPLLHLHTQANESLPWSEIDMDFMNLNQAAHGDREFAHVQTRLGVARKTVAGHVSDPDVSAADPHWIRACAGAAALRQLRMARFGDNMRNVAVTDGDKVEAEHRFGVSVNSYAVNDLVAAVDQVGDDAVDDLIDAYLDLYDVAAELRPGGEPGRSLRDAARIEAGLRAFLDDGGFRGFTTNFEDLGGLRQLPGLAVQRLMADGYGFGAEGDWKTGAMVHTLKAMSVGSPAGRRSWRTTRTTSARAQPKVLGAHMLEVCPSITTSTARVSKSTRSTSAAATIRSASVRRRLRAGDHRRARRPRRPLPIRAQRGRSRPTRRADAAPACRPRHVDTAASTDDGARVLADQWRTTPHRAVVAIDTDAIVDLATMLRTELVVIDETRHPPLRRRTALEPGLLPTRSGLLIATDADAGEFVERRGTSCLDPQSAVRLGPCGRTRHSGPCERRIATAAPGRSSPGP